MEAGELLIPASEYGFIRDGKVYRKGYQDYPEKQIGEVKNSDEFSLRYFTQRFELLTEKVDKVLGSIEEAQNKGSFLMKLLHLRSILPTYDAIGDFGALDVKLGKAQEEIEGLIGGNRVKNLEIKRALLNDTLEVVKDVSDWSAASETVKTLKEKWLKTGAVSKEHEEEIEAGFTNLINDFYHRRKLFFDDRQRVMLERLALYQSVLDRALPLADRNANPSASMRTFKMLQAEWKAVGLVPKSHLEPIITKFKQAQKTIFRNFKNFKLNQKPAELSPQDRLLLENMKKKVALTEQAKALIQIDLREAYNLAKDLQAKWKDIGPVPDRDKRIVNDNFTLACDRIFEMSYLMRTVYVRNRFFNSKSILEQYTIKIDTMREIIAKDETELQAAEAEFNRLSPTDQRLPANKPLYSKISTQGRKLKVKKQLLYEFQDQMRAFKP